METMDLSMNERFILKAKGIIEDNIGNARFGVKELAEEMNLCRAQLFRKFKQLIGSPPSQFISEIRLQRAACLIRSNANTLTQIGYSVGFSEQSYFSKRFRKKYGLSPSAYANLHPFRSKLLGEIVAITAAA
jgi:AraC-like DNA-binding protein